MSDYKETFDIVKEENSEYFIGLEEGELNKGIKLDNKINDHIIKLVHKTKGLEGMHIETVMQHIRNHLDDFDDLEYAKMMGGDLEYLNERKALLDEYDEIFEHFILTIEKITKMHPSLETIGAMFKEIRGSPYYTQLTKCVNFISFNLLFWNINFILLKSF